MELFKIRASACGQIMTEARSKKEKLSKTTKTYLQTWLKEKIYNSKNFSGSKHTEKGLEMESEAIDYLSIVDECFYLKNEKSYENDFLTGTPDIVTDEFIIDIKCPWNEYTFPLFEDQIPTKDYFYQLQAYMHLTGRKKAKLAYCLMDTPEELLNQWTDVPYSYEGLDTKYRIKTYEIEYDEEVIKQIQQRVEDCREYIQELLDGLHK
jgi:hypothetical protein